METWVLLLISGAVPAVITVVGPHMSARLKARQAARKTDADIAADIRDELRQDNAALRVRVDVLEVEVGNLRTWVLRLEDALRRRAPDDFERLKRDYLDEAAG